ncbi:hypothetical protein [Bradyrhizobium japonicum]|jgi:hypothetical protein|uniref:hypothetical protein n=1 Tax=Bradyrhizobium japonicum TaxID=375 RepID=UPI0012FD6F6C|nr:hypothetical protein [Bradyrhizobium japonicum]
MRAAIFRASFGPRLGFKLSSLLGIRRRDLAICLAQRLIGRAGLIGCKHRKRLRPQGRDLLLEYVHPLACSYPVW